MRRPFFAPLLAFWSFLPILGIGCSGGGGDPAGPAPQLTASVSGTVRRVGTREAIAGATVTAGAASATTAADGRFQLSNVPVGTVNVGASATRFEAHGVNVVVQPGVNTVDLDLSVRTVYQQGEILAFLPPDVSSFKGAILFLAGSTGDSRPLVRGDVSLPDCLGWCGVIRTEMRQRSLLLAEKYGLAIIGMTSMENSTTTYDLILAALAAFGAQSGRVELGQAPLLLVGHSAGGCLAYGFTRLHAPRVIGFMSGKGQCHSPTAAGPFGALAVPGYFFIGEADLSSRRENITAVFEENRPLGALWAVAIEPGAGHAVPQDVELQIKWMDIVLANRLPVTNAAVTPVTLRSITETSGWLGNRSSGAIGHYSCYNEDKRVASWMPSEQTARDWQAFVAGSAGVGCASG